MNYGYTRVSTGEQDLETQVNLIKKTCPDAMIYGEKTGGASEKPVLGSLIDEMKKGDTLYLYAFDRLSRSSKEALELISSFMERGIRIVSLTQDIDTRTPQGELMFTIYAGLSQYERKLIGQRTKAKLALLKEQGVILGRPRKTTDTDALKNYVLEIIDEANWDWKVVSNRVKETFEVEYSPAYLRNKFYGWTDKRKPRKYLRA